MNCADGHTHFVNIIHFMPRKHEGYVETFEIKFKITMTLLKICKWNRQTQKKNSLPYMCTISPNSPRLIGLNMLQSLYVNLTSEVLSCLNAATGKHRSRV
jgi:hypothetical protein